MSKPKYYIELCENKIGKQRYWFRIRHRNGHIIASSEKYASRRGRTNSARNLARFTAADILEEWPQ